MKEEQHYSTCKRFDSLTLPCPHRDEECFFLVRNHVSQSPPPGMYLGKELDMVTEICSNCKSYVYVYSTPIRPVIPR